MLLVLDFGGSGGHGFPEPSPQYAFSPSLPNRYAFKLTGNVNTRQINNIVIVDKDIFFIAVSLIWD
jgi:hypothetical protein